MAFLASPSAWPELSNEQILAVGGDGQVVGIIAGQVSPALTIAVGVESLPPAGLDMSLVAGGRLEHDEAVTEQ